MASTGPEPISAPVLSLIGAFDGLHLGHQALVRHTVDDARALGAVVCGDECYAELGWDEWDGEIVPCILSEEVSGGDLTGLLSVYSLSKQSNLAGYRAAFAAGDPGLVATLVNTRKHAGMIVPAPVQHAMAVALADEGHVAQQKDRYRRRRDALRAALEASGHAVDHSEAGLYLWTRRADTDPAAATEQDSWDLLGELADLGIAVHLIKGYGDTAVAESAIALMWSSARVIAQMDREMRAGNWLREDGMQLTGKTLGLVGFGGIAAEVARIAHGSGMKVIAWNRSPKSHPGVEFTDLDTVLATSDVVSLHLLLNDETRGMITRDKIAKMKQGVVLINTARGAIVDEQAMIDALNSGHIRHAGLDVYNIEPLPKDHPLTKIPNVTLSAHSAFRTPEASENLIHAAWQHCRRIVKG